MDSHTKTLIGHMVKRTRTTFTERHQKVLEFAYEYYARHSTGPLYHGIKKNTGVSQAELDQMFPNGLASVYMWVGIPVHAGQKVCKPAVSLQMDELRQVYLDYAATTPLLDEVAEGIGQVHAGEPLLGNPSSSHKVGKRAYEVVAQARERLGECLGVDPQAIVFTSGGSEANNLALKGLAFQRLSETGKRGHIVSTQIEHSSVLSSLKFLESLGFTVSLVEPSRDGSVLVSAIERALSPETFVVSVMAANNETGVTNPIGDIGALCQRMAIPLMVDAVQCFGKRPLNPTELNVSLMSISAHKIGGPKGMGALYIQPGLRLAPLIHGGDQEHGLRAGTENVMHIHAFGIAAAAVRETLPIFAQRLASLQDYFLQGLKAVEKRFVINGNLFAKLPHIVNIGFEGIDSGSLLLSLANIGVSVAAGSACTAGKGESSHVLRAMGVNTDKYGTIRFSFGLGTKKDDLDYLFKYLPTILSQLRQRS
jgi:cysteine desulfurase